jgi:SOS-response transcriptional repressor LexA
MNFQKLQDRLRKRLLAQIEAGEMTGLGLAHETGFQQAHISNFLNRRRALSLEAMDRVLSVMRWSVVDLMEDAELRERIKRVSPREADYENVPLVEAPNALAQPVLGTHLIAEVLKFKKTFLRRLRPDAVGRRSQWQRFVLVKVDAREGMSMYPRLLPGATLLIDRHYNALRPYRRSDRNMYAVRFGGAWTIKYVEVSGRTLVLRPENKEYPVSVVQVDERESPTEYILGRVAHVAIET